MQKSSYWCATWRKSSILVLMASIASCVCSPAARAQATGDYFRNSLSGGFIGEVKVGPHYDVLNDAVGFSVNYSYRPKRWLALETGLELVPRPVGSSVCCRYATNANDDLYLVPFGARYVFESQERRVRLTLGGGGAYLNYAVGAAQSQIGAFSGWVGQFVASGDYGITRSGALRIGLQVRYYYGSPKFSLPAGTYPPGYSASTPFHILTMGPQFTFAFH